MSFILPIVYFILSNGLLVLISKKTFGKCLPLTMMITAFTYFFSQCIFKTFKIGFYINILFAVLFILLLVMYKIRDKDLDSFKKCFFSKGFYSFIVMYICVYILNYNRAFSMWDEFSHWGEMIKEMIRLDRFYSVDTSTLMAHKDYPPIVQLFELFFCNLSGGYKESYLIRAVHLFSFSLFIPAICESDSKFSKIKTSIKAILLMGITFLVLLLFDQHGVINSIYTDYIMAILVAYLLSIVIFEKNTLSTFNLINLSIACSFLIMTKQIGITLYLMFLFMFVIDLLIKNKLKIKNIINKKNVLVIIKVLVLLILIPMMFWKGWAMYVDALDLEQQFKLSDLKVSELGGIIRGTSGEKYQQEAAMNYISAIKSRGMTTSSKISLSYFQCIILVLLLLYFIWIYGKKYFYKGQIPLTSVTLILGFIGYAFVMLVMYVFSFGPREGPNLASFDRYMPTYILVCMSLIVMLFTYIDSKNDKKSEHFKYCILIFVILFLVQTPALTAKMFPKLMNDPKSVYEYHAEIISGKTEENSKVFLIAQNSLGQYQYYVKYYMNPRLTNLNYFNLPVEDINNYEEYFQEEVKDYMLEYDYLYLVNIDEEFVNKYGFIFPNDSINNEQLYKIDADNEKIKLTLVK